MNTDKTTIGLSIVLVVVVVMTVFSASFPASGSEATQNASVTKNTTAVSIMNQSALQEVTSWTFTGKAGETNVTPANNVGDIQNIANINESVATLKNTDPSYNMTVSLTFGNWSPEGKVGKEYGNITAKNTNASVSST